MRTEIADRCDRRRDRGTLLPTAAGVGGREDLREVPELPGVSLRQLHPSEVLACRQDWGERSTPAMSTCASRTLREAIAIPA